MPADKKLKIVFCGYRTWALSVIEQISNHPRLESPVFLNGKEEFDEAVSEFGEDIDVLVFLGWSWILPEAITERYTCVGVHPSDLPNFRGGSPLQHQILAGITDSKVSLFSLSSKLDAGGIWAREPLDLTGESMEVVFSHLVTASLNLLNRFIDEFPDIEPEIQILSNGSYFKRRLEGESRMDRSVFLEAPLVDIYNFIRCLTAPYPNAYLEDEQGNRLFFTGIKYLPKQP